MRYSFINVNVDEEEKDPNFDARVGDKKYTTDELANVLRQQYPKYQDPNFSNDYIVSKAVNAIPELNNLLYEAPTPGEQFKYSVENLLNTFTHGTPEFVRSVVDMVNITPLADGGAPEWLEGWSADWLDDFEKDKERRRKEDVRYAAWENWNASNTGIDEWGDLVDPQMIARSLSNWASTGVTWGTGVATGAVSKNPWAVGGAMFTIGAMLEGSDEAVSSVEYLTKDRVISVEDMNSQLKEFTDLIPKDTKKSEHNALVSEFMKNFRFDKNGTVYEKGLSIEEAQHLNAAAVAGYGLTAGFLEMIPAFRVMKKIPGAENMYRKYAHGTWLHK